MCGIWLATTNNSTREYFNNFMKLKHRGPDKSTYIITKDTIYGFHRLAINDLSNLGDQPLIKKGINLICNGEIYNHNDIRSGSDIKNIGGSDCEMVINAYINNKNENKDIIDFIKKISGEFSFIMYDENESKYIVARDHVGVRPLFYGYSTKNKCFIFSSEAKGLLNIVDKIIEFPIGSIMVIDNKYEKKYNIKKYECVNKFSIEYGSKIIECSYDIKLRYIAKILSDNVKKRLMSDRNIGFLLSGGLDSSIICYIASTLLSSNRIRTFSIGTNKNSPDLVAGRKMAKHIGSNHTEVLYTIEDGLDAIRDVIYHTESYDCTTIRASVPMYLISKFIKENTDIKVLISGEGADEIFGGYLYLRNAPNAEEFKKECERLINNLYTFDIKRADRVTAANGIELRVPFLDSDIINISNEFSNAELFNKNGIEKKILRDAFRTLIPDFIIDRQKDAFSDAVGYDWVDNCKLLSIGTPHTHFSHNTPLSEEEYYYRYIFNGMFEDINADLIPEIWRPKWTNNVTDPSAKGLEIHEFNKSK